MGEDKVEKKETVAVEPKKVEPPKPKAISEVDVTEIKAAIYDEQVKIQQSSQFVQALQAELVHRRENGNTVQSGS